MRQQSPSIGTPLEASAASAGPESRPALNRSEISASNALRRHLAIQQPLAFRLNRLTLGDVDARAGVAGEDTVGRIARHAAFEHPAVAVIAVKQAIFDLEIAARIECLAICGEAAFTVQRMQAPHPALAELLIRGASGEIQPRLIEVIA